MFGAEATNKGRSWDIWGGSAAPLCHPGKVIQHPDLRICRFSKLRQGEMMIQKCRVAAGSDGQRIFQGAPGLPCVAPALLKFGSV